MASSFPQEINNISGSWNIGGSTTFTNPLNNTETLNIPLTNLPHTAKAYAISITITQNGPMPNKSFYLSIGTGNYRPISGNYLRDIGGTQTLCSPLLIVSTSPYGIVGIGWSAASGFESFASDGTTNILPVKLYGEYYSGATATGIIELLYM